MCLIVIAKFGSGHMRVHASFCLHICSHGAAHGCTRCIHEFGLCPSLAHVKVSRVCDFKVLFSMCLLSMQEWAPHIATATFCHSKMRTHQITLPLRYASKISLVQNLHTNIRIFTLTLPNQGVFFFS